MKNKKIWLEKLHNYVGQFFKINSIIINKNSKFQKIFIFKNNKFGKILVLDNILQTTTYDEFIYHEMICLIPIFSHPNPKDILIIGGGDGGCLKQITKLHFIKSITLVEIDKKIIKYSKKYLFKIHKNSFYDKRVKIIIDNGINYLNNTKKKFDIIIIDGTDPIGPGKNLFTKNFYFYCSKTLNNNGIIVSQSGTYMLQKKEALNNLKNIKKIFNITGFYNASVPTYYGGNILFIWGSNNINIKKPLIKEQNKINKYKFKYYNINIHKSSFILPQFFIEK